MDALKKTFKVQVFATDIDARAIDTARAGVYPASIATRCFARTAGALLLRGGRRLSHSQEHSRSADLLRTRCDQRSSVLQARPGQLPQSADLHGPGAATKADPALPLCAQSERLCSCSARPRRWAISRSCLRPSIERPSSIDRTGTTARPSSHRLASSCRARAKPRAASSQARPSTRAGGLPLRELTERALLSRAPVGALVNEHGDILYLHGQTGKFLEPSPGEPVLNIVKMARQGLRQDLTSALRRAAGARRARFLSECAGQDQRRLHDHQSDGPAGIRRQRPSADCSSLFLVAFEELSGVDQRLAAPNRRRTSERAEQRRGATDRSTDAGVARQRRAPAQHARANANLERGAQILERGAAVDQRGAAIHQRGAGDLQRGAAVGQRGTGDRQFRAAGQSHRSCRVPTTT